MAVSLTGAAHNAQANNAVSVTTSGWTTASGCVLVALGMWYSAAAVDDTISDSKGNTWTQVAASISVNGASWKMKAWVCAPTSVGASHTVTLTRGAAAYTSHELCVLELAGADTTLPLGAAIGSATGSSTTPSASTGTLDSADGAVIGHVGLGWSTGGSRTITNDSEFTNDADLTSGDGLQLHVGHKIVSASTSVTYDPTLSASTAWGDLVFFVKASGGGGGGNPWYYRAQEAIAA